jgi:hypothetical protein
MILSDRFKVLIEYSKLSIPKFAEFVGFKTPQAVREIINGRTKTLSDAAQMKILKSFPELNRDWLLYGEGEMLRSMCTQNVEDSKNFTQTGNVTVNNSDAALLKAIDEISEQRKMVQKAQEQIDRLITLLEKR